MLDSLQILMLGNRMLYHRETFSHAELTLYAGLRATGANVVMYPWSPLYHGVSSCWQDNWHFQFWHTRGGYNGITQQAYSYDDVCRMRFDLLISTARFGTVNPQFLLEAKEHFGCGLAMVCVDDGGSGPWGIDDEWIDIKFRAEVPLDSTEDCYPLPQSIMYPASLLSRQEKEVGIHAYFSYNHPTRRREWLVSQLELMEGNHCIGIVKDVGHIDLADYLKILQRSKVKYGIRGNGYNSQHFWEGFAAEGVVLIADIEHKIPPPVPEPGVHYVQLDDSDVIGQAEQWLNADEEREAMAAKSREFCYRYHTPRQRGLYFLEKCEEHLPELKGKQWRT